MAPPVFNSIKIQQMPNITILTFTKSGTTPAAASATAPAQVQQVQQQRPPQQGAPVQVQTAAAGRGESEGTRLSANDGGGLDAQAQPPPPPRVQAQAPNQQTQGPDVPVPPQDGDQEEEHQQGEQQGEMQVDTVFKNLPDVHTLFPFYVNGLTQDNWNLLQRDLVMINANHLVPPILFSPKILRPFSREIIFGDYPTCRQWGILKNLGYEFLYPLRQPFIGCVTMSLYKLIDLSTRFASQDFMELDNTHEFPKGEIHDYYRIREYYNKYYRRLRPSHVHDYISFFVQPFFQADQPAWLVRKRSSTAGSEYVVLKFGLQTCYTFYENADQFPLLEIFELACFSPEGRFLREMSTLFH